MVTIPMVQTIYFLEKQQEMLCNLLKKKDKELEQYRLERELISRSKFIRTIFNYCCLFRQNLNNKMDSFVIIF